MPETKAIIEIKVDGVTLINADTEYISDNCFLNEKINWIEKRRVNGFLEIVITPYQKPLTILDRIKWFFWDLVIRINDAIKRK